MTNNWQNEFEPILKKNGFLYPLFCQGWGLSYENPPKYYYTFRYGNIFGSIFSKNFIIDEDMVKQYTTLGYKIISDDGYQIAYVYQNHENDKLNDKKD